MADPVSTVNGIASGIQWQTMVEQIIAIDTQRTVTPLTTQQTSLDSAAAAWTEFQGVVAKFRDAAQALRDATAFGYLDASASKSQTTGRDLMSVSASAAASPGTYSVAVDQLATAEKLGGAVATSATTALGIAGAFMVNGRSVTVSLADTLNTLRDAINALDSGASATGVRASIVNSTAGARLVLSADQAGASGVELVDDSGGTLQSLGFTDSTLKSNITASGATQTFRVSSSTAAFASLFGIPLPTPSTITVGGQTITVDFSVDSLATIAARINAATGKPDAATVVTETIAGRTYSRLQSQLAVEANPADAANSARVLAMLGFTMAGRGALTQVVKSNNTFTDAANASANVVGTTKLSAMQVAGQSLGVSAGDVITISGTRGDGTSVTRTLIVGGDSTLQDLIDSANNASSGFGAGTRTGTVSVSNGHLVLTDGTAGDSQLGMSISIAKSAGGTVSLGSFSAADGTVGLNRQIITGSDAVFSVDGQTVTRSTNSVSDVLTGVTFNLLAAEQGTSVRVSVSRSYDKTVTAMQTLASAFNAVRSWADTNTAIGGRLAKNSSVRSMVSTLSSTLLTSVTGLTGSYTTPSLVGLNRDKTGVMSVDSTILKGALASNFEDVQKLFARSAAPSDSAVFFHGATSATKPTANPYGITITQAATTASTIGLPFASYLTAGTPDTMTVTDVATGYFGSIALANGDAIDTVVAHLNTLFAANKMQLAATNSGGAVQITSHDYGSKTGFSVSYTAGSGDGTAQIGIPVGSYAGIDVAGTIGGLSATGQGQYLVGDSDSPVEGLAIKYTGTTARAAGTVSYSLGLGGMLYAAADGIADDLDGLARTNSVSATAAASALDARIAAARDRIATRKATLTAQFLAMESAMSKAQSVGTSLTSTINSLFSYNKQA